jgi:hypothetical protein
MKLKEKLDLWVKITGVNPQRESKSYTIHFNDSLSNYDIEKMNKRITEALQYDDTGLFASAYLSCYFKTYLHDRKLDAMQIATDKSMDEYIKDIRYLYRALEEDDAEQQILSEAHRAMDYYGLNHDELGIFDIIELRTSATKCMESLQTVQFTRGKISKEGFKVIPDVYMYDDISAVVSSAMKGYINGVSLCYIRDEKLEDSYFAFIIKNGDNLYLITDKPSYVHPNQKYMKRCPGRDMNNRINTAWFPYSLTNINMDDMYYSGRYAVHEKGNGLSNETIDDNGIKRAKIGSLATMSQDEAFWAVVMLSMIHDKFYLKEYQCNELSFVGGMIKHPAIENGSYDLTVYESMPHLTLDKIIDPASIDLTYERESLHIYDYIVERFKDQVPESIYNMAGATDRPLIGSKEGRKKELLALALNDFGTSVDIKYRQQWIARYNMAVEIHRLSTEDHSKNKSKVNGIIYSYIEGRKEEIIKMALKEELVTRRLSSKNTFGYEFTDELEIYSSIQSFDSWYDNYPYDMYKVGQKSIYIKSDYKCNLSGKIPGVVICITPNNASDLALLCGITINELPEQLKHWTKERIYLGNSILDNLDPFDWVISDPYREENYRIAFFLSKQTYSSLRKQLGLKEDKFWLKDKPPCYNENTNSSNCYGRYKDIWNKTVLMKCIKCKYYSQKTS